ncbi:MAG: hypothetical protein ACI910_002916 [Oleispira sp.]|jgi:hypothetical protein
MSSDLIAPTWRAYLNDKVQQAVSYIHPASMIHRGIVKARKLGFCPIDCRYSTMHAFLNDLNRSDVLSH